VWLKTQLKAAVTPGVRQALRSLQRELRNSRIHRKESARIRRTLAGRNGMFNLHLGSGSHHLPGWINIDLTHPSADYHLDLRQRFPWEDATVERIYSEHFVEHLSYPGELEPFLAECQRVLRPGGFFEAGMPDVERNLAAYAKRDEQFFRQQRESWWSPKWCVTHLDSINFTFRQGGEHKFAYDFETLFQRLSEAGFVDIRRRPWNQETDSPGWEQSLYVTAVKPG
jgi:predicted SAM-dependent methyltransferase